MNNYYEAMVHQGQATSPSAHQIELVNLQSQLAEVASSLDEPAPLLASVLSHL